MRTRVSVIGQRLLCVIILTCFVASAAAQHEFNGSYSGRNLDRIAFPIGGIGAGMYCLEGTGAISHVSIRHRMEFFHEPSIFAAVCVLGDTPEANIARVLEGPMPDWKHFGNRNSANGSPGTTYGLPRFKECTFSAKFPFAKIALSDPSLPIDAEIVGWSPFTPPHPDPSSLPVGALEYRLVNKTDAPVKGVFSLNSRQWMGSGSISATEGGFVLHEAAGDGRETKPSFAFFVLDEKTTFIDHCWFRGGWWDALTLAWNNVASGHPVNNPPVANNAPGATLAVPFELPARGEKTVRLLTAWYVPESQLAVGTPVGPAFSDAPATGAAKNQNAVTGFLGRGLVNTYSPGGDGQVGQLVSSPFLVRQRYIHFLVGGGTECQADLVVDGRTVHRASGKDSETLAWVTWDVASLAGSSATIRLADETTAPWGHLNVDHIVFSDETLDKLRTGSGNEIVTDPARVTVFEDFERDSYSGWHRAAIGDDTALACDPSTGCCPEPVPTHYKPWYATVYDSVDAVVAMWRRDYTTHRQTSQRFADAFYDSTLPPEVMEAVAANLTILKSPTVLRQHDGRLWCWEGCSDDSGCCSGSCTHVWNYAQALCHLFPSLERTLRQTEYVESSASGTGRQAFRANLPITPGGVAFDAADGQLGGVMKVYREWRITNDAAWLKAYWHRVKKSLDFMIASYDPRHTGLLEESHHNTYDINYFGPDGHCGSFYLGALAAAVEMGAAIGDDVPLYRELLAKGQKRFKEELYSGEYFIQIVMKEGLNENFGPINPRGQSEGYRTIAAQVNEQGAKYQYGTGCLSDGVLGFWMAKVCGFDAPVLGDNDDLIRNHLLAVYKYNMRHDLSEHANPQRPTYAMGDDGGLLLCTWPHGNKPLLPFVYSDEVWTGIEYQVASHLMLLGCVDEGLDIVRTLRKRHDGVRRNPFNEYECGHWYARAMASYALLQGMTGVRYDAPAKTLWVSSRCGDFRSFLCTETGYGVVVVKDGKASVEVRHGTIDVAATRMLP